MILLVVFRLIVLLNFGFIFLVCGLKNIVFIEMIGVLGFFFMVLRLIIRWLYVLLVDVIL